MNKLDWAFAHSEGRCDIIYVEEHSVVSSGADGQVRRYDTSPAAIEQMEDPTLLYDHDRATCIAVSREKEWIAVGFSDNQVHLLKYPTGEFEKILVRLQLPVRHVAFSPDGLYLAVAGEGSIKLVNLVDTTQITVFKGHQGPVRSLAFDPKGDYFASSGADGTVRIWNLRDCTEAKCLSILPKGDPDSPPLLSRLDWHPQGLLLAVPTDEGVVMLARDTWETASKLKGEHKKGVNIFRWSPNGLYGASAGHSDNTVFIWRVKEEETIDKVTCKSAVQGIAWSPASNVLALINEAGQWSNWQDVIPSTWPNPYAPIEEEDDIELEAKPSASSLMADLFDQEAEQPEEDQEQPKEEAPASYDDDDLAGLLDDEAKEVDDEEEDNENKDNEDQLDVLDDLAVEDKGHDIMDVALEEEADVEQENKKPTAPAVRPYNVVRIPPMKAQPAFQPNAGPSIESKRYLAWTLFGMIQLNKEVNSSFIEVEFSDTSLHKNFRVANLYNFSMASMSPQGVLFAAKSGEGYPANIMFRPFDRWTTNTEWSIKMPAEEEIDAITVGGSWCAVATSTGVVRILSIGGIQLSILSIPGPVVSMAAHDNLLAIVYHLTPPTRDRQNIEIKLLDIKKSECVTTIPMPLNTSRATLQWIGFSELGTLLVRDSVGQVCGLFNTFGWNFVPIFNFAELNEAVGEEADPKSEQFWIIGMKGEQMLCVAVDPDTDQPPVDQKPEIVGFSLSLPLVKDTPVGVDEERQLRNKLLINYKKFMLGDVKEKSEVVERELMDEQLEADKHLLGMIQKACQTSKAARALDYASQLNFPKSLAIAAKLAERSSLNELARRIEDILNKKVEQLHPDKQKAADTSSAASASSSAPPSKAKQAQADEEEEDTQLPLHQDKKKKETKLAGKKRTRDEDEEEQDEEEEDKEDEDDEDLSDYEREAKRRRQDESRMEQEKQTKRSTPAPTESQKHLLSSMFGEDDPAPEDGTEGNF